MPQHSPDRAREAFIDALESARRDLVTKGGDGSQRALGLQLGVSPSRVGDWLRPGFQVALRDPEDKAIKGIRLRKGVAGFVASAERATAWLCERGYLDATSSATRVAALLEGYWPKDDAELARLFDAPETQAGIKDGRTAAAAVPSEMKRIEVKAMAWNAFMRVDGDVCSGFFDSYARDVFRMIDPFDCDVEVRPVYTLAEVLDTTPRSSPDGRVVVLGLYDTLYRRFRGRDFAGIPLFRAPLVGLEVWRENNAPPPPRSFEILFGRGFGESVFVLHRQVGHLHLAALTSEPERINVVGDDTDALVIAHRLREELQGSSEVLQFLADGTIALEVFHALKGLRGVSVRVVAQETPTDLAHTIGFMLTKEDDDLRQLIEAAQATIFRTPWRVADVFRDFTDSIDRWTSEKGLTAEASEWSAPIFIFDKRALSRLVRSKPDMERLVSSLKDIWATSRMPTLWSFTPVPEEEPPP